MDKVCVFMSTYNGEKYLCEQLDSIFRQKGVDVVLYIRDDGSLDNTVHIIEEYRNRGSNIVIRKGENVGFQKSFALISHEYVEADYYAFADQDDVWKPEKLIHAVRMLETVSEPVLYGGNILITNADLQNKTKWAVDDKELTYRESLIKNCFALGYNTYACSMVWNRKLQLLVEKHMPGYFVSQDVYLTILAGCTGHLIVDGEAMIWHRMHDNNTAGIEKNLWKRIRKGYRLYWGKQRRRLSWVAEEIILAYSDQIIKGKPGVDILYKVAECSGSWKARWKLLNSSEMKIIKKISRLRIAGFIIAGRL